MTNPSPHVLTDDAIARLEQATLDAVAPAHTEDLGHWLLAFDPSTINRAKSAAPKRHHGLDAHEAIGIVQRYRHEGLEPLFRIPDLPGLTHIHNALRESGLAPTQPTLVQVARVIDILALPTPWQAEVTLQPSTDWGEVYTAPGFDPVDGAFRREALSRSPFVVYASIQQNSTPVAAGTASLSQGWASIHGMRTVMAARGQGLARGILVALARHAQRQGLSDTFLQVEEGNRSARTLYAQAGFHTAWRYHYWR